MERKEFEDNKVYLWGLKQASPKLLKEYDIGNKNPQSLARKKKEDDKRGKTPKKTVKETKKREFNLEEDYGVSDLPFLKSESERIDKALDEGEVSGDEENHYMDLQDAIYNLIEGLEAMKKLSGEGLYNDNNDDYNDEDFYLNKSNKNFSKKSDDNYNDEDDDYPDTSELKPLKDSFEGGRLSEQVSQPLKEIKPKPEPKPKPETKQPTKSRVVKGSEEAKELGRRLAEARKAKNADKKAEADKKKEEEKKAKEEAKQAKLKPWYYIGDIPKGYREANEDEAIRASKVSEYGKYTVDKTKYQIYEKYNILLSTKLNNFELNMYSALSRKKAIRALEDIEIYESKIDNPKYDSSKYQWKLDEAKEDYNLLSKAYNALMKFIATKANREYKKVVIKLPPKPEIKFSKEERIDIPIKVDTRIDPRTGKPVSEEEKYINKQNKNKIIFKRGEEELTLNDSHFDKNKMLKSKTAKKLFDKHIILPSEYYSPEDYKKYHYIKQGSGLFDNMKSMMGWTLNKTSLSSPKEYRTPYQNITKPLTTPIFDWGFDKTNFTRKAKEIIDYVGNKPIASIHIVRNPVQKAITELMNITSKGEFNKRFSGKPYDDLFHLKLVMETNDNKLYSIEKTAVVNLEMPPVKADKSEDKKIMNIPNITLNQMIQNCMNRIGKDKFFLYDGVNNNCQDFVLNLLQSSNIGNQDDYNFIKQDTQDLFEGLHTTKNIMKGATDTGAMFSGLLGGSLVPRKPDLSKKDIVQSIVFNKRMWTPDRAKEFLINNKYYSGSMDETKTQYRFRQYNPEDLQGRQCITKSIKDKGILLIISMLKSKGGKIEKIIDSDSDSDSSSDEESVSMKKLSPKHRKLINHIKRHLKGKGFDLKQITPVLKEVGKFALPLLKDELKDRMKKGNGLLDPIAKGVENYLMKGFGVRPMPRSLHNVGQEEPEMTGGNAFTDFFNPVKKAFTQSWNNQGDAQSRAAAKFVTKDMMPALSEVTSIIAPPVSSAIDKTSGLLNKHYGFGVKKRGCQAAPEVANATTRKRGRPRKQPEAVHIDINSHNVKDGEYTMGDGLKKKKGTKALKKTKNPALEQYLEVIKEKRDDKLKDLLLKKLEGGRITKGSPEMKEKMARLRAMRKKK